MVVVEMMEVIEVQLTSAMLFKDGAAINTTYGVNSDVRKIFSACGSTSKMAIFPSLWMRRIVSNLVPYIASSWVPVKYIRTNIIINIMEWYLAKYARTHRAEPRLGEPRPIQVASTIVVYKWILLLGSHL